MTPATTILNSALDARAANLRQAQFIQAAADLVRAMNRTQLDDRQRSLVRNAGALLDAFAALNAAEGESERAILGVADRFAPAREAWSQNKVIRQTREHLAVLLNPMLAPGHAAAERAVLDVIASAPPELVGSHSRPNLTVRNQLGVNKTSRLWDLVEGSNA